MNPLQRTARAAALILGLVTTGTAGEIVFPGERWEQRSPAELGLDAEKLEAFAARIGGDGVIIKDGFLVKTWGEVATHKWWASASKPVLSTLLLAAVHEGKPRLARCAGARRGMDVVREGRADDLPPARQHDERLRHR